MVYQLNKALKWRLDIPSNSAFLPAFSPVGLLKFRSWWIRKGYGGMDFGVAHLLHRPRIWSIRGGRSPGVTVLSRGLGWSGSSPGWRSDLPPLEGIDGLALTLGGRRERGWMVFLFRFFGWHCCLLLIAPVLAVRKPLLQLSGRGDKTMKLLVEGEV